MASWKVIITEKAQLEFLNMKKKGLLTKEDQDIIYIWTKEILTNGLSNILDSKKWNDHKLEGNWKGYRSSSFSFKGRIIYKVENQKILVEVVRITTSHDYTKGKTDG